MKAIGYLTNPTTKPGKVFTACERGVTRVMEKLATNDTYLNFAGRMMERSFRMQSKVIRAREDALRAWRMPTTTDVDDLRAELRRLNDQAEATSAQLELVIEALEELKHRKPEPPPDPAAPTAPTAPTAT
jgi:hypothetical protein